jgi:type VI secretion system FHA domain protein
MALQITLVKAPKAVSIAKTSHMFDKRGGTLGRSDSNLWVLPDLEKFLSSCHCEVLFESGAYFLLDLSTNGTFINSAFEPIGKGSKVPLKHGDVFDIGEYRFSSEIIDDQPLGYSKPQPSTPSQPKSPFADDFFGAGIDTPAQPFATSSDFVVSDFSAGLAQSQDPLAAFDKVNKRPNDDIFGKPAPFASQGFNSPSEHKGFSGTSSVDLSPNIDQAISWPTASQESLIPEDWEDDLLGSPAKKSPFDNGDPFDSFDDEPLAPVFGARDAAPQQLQPQNLQPQRKLEPFPLDSDPIAESIEVPVIPRPANNLAARIAEMPEIKAAPVVTPIAVAPVAASAVASSGGSHTLIAAMGLNPDKLSAEEIDGISESVGLLMREITEGMMQVLRSRTSIKNEFRMNVTTIQPIENNPLKFSVGADEALENMFLKKTNAYKKPVDAFREGFQEIGEHQVAMIAGIRHGFERMIERFNPENLELQFNKQGKGAVIPGMQNAKHWTNYKSHYQGYSDNMESSFQHLFGSDFVSAYEDQLRKLSSQRKKNK